MEPKFIDIPKATGATLRNGSRSEDPLDRFTLDQVLNPSSQLSLQRRIVGGIFGVTRMVLLGKKLEAQERCLQLMS